MTTEVSRLFRAGAQWVHEGETHTMVAVKADEWPTMAVLENARTGEMVDVPFIRAVAEQSDWVTPPEPRLRSDFAASLDLLSEKNRAKAFERAGHIREVLCGNSSGGLYDASSCDVRYDPACTSREDRIKVKLGDLKGMRGYSRSSFYEFLTIYESTDGNVAALAPGGIPTPSDPRDGLAPEVVESIGHIVAEFNTEAWSVIDLDAKILHLRRELDKAGIVDPALRARRLKALIKFFQKGIPQDSAVQRRSKASRNTSGTRRPRPSQPLERVEIDATQLNIETFDPDSKGAFRPWVLVGSCFATKLFHARLCAEKPTTRDVRMLIFDMMRPVVLPDVDRDHLLLAGVPQQLVIRQTDEIGCIVIDNGSEMVGTSLIDLSLRFGIDIEGCRTRTGSDKGHVESVNSALDRLQQWFRGYLGNAAHKRGADVKPAMSFSAASRIVQEFAHSFHPYIPHTGLPVDPHSTTLLMPAQAYARAIARGAAVQTEVHPDMVFGMLDSEMVAVHGDVVRHAGLKYWAPELSHITRESEPASPYEKSTRIFYDPADKSRVFSYSKEKERWFSLHAIHDSDHDVPPFSDILMDEYLFDLRQKRLTMDGKLDLEVAFVEFCDRIIEQEPLRWARDRAKLQTALPEPQGTPGAPAPPVVEVAAKDFPLDMESYVEDFEMARVVVREEQW